ncbi:MAG: hypothetical protein NZ480_08785, partial [Bdellovibrionaceae bacterium]|nr:hypothetical protein [Pseudobdellovibrionaceae bacterium]
MITQLRNITLLSVMIMSVVLGYAQISSQDVKVLERLLGSKVSLNNSEIQQILNQMRDPAMRKAALRRATYNLDVFYEVSVKNFATRMAVRSEEVSSPLNDFSATVIGIVRDNLDARQMLTGNFLYAANPTLIPAGINIRNNLINDRLNSNNHYLDIENNLYRLNVASILVRVPQEVLDVPVNNNPTINNVVPNPDPGGLLTSYTWGREHLVAGTNRRPVEYALRSFLCTPMELAADTLANDSHVGRDIDRNPGGDPNRYLTTCKGCHTIMDGFRGAFAMWNFAMNNNGGGILVHGSLHRNRLDINNGIARKMNQNANVYSDG